MNKFTTITKCRCCNSNVELLLDLGNQPLANSYHEKDVILDEYPLQLNLCKDCWHTQLSVVVDPALMFRNYLYVSGTTSTLTDYFNWFSQFCIERYINYFNVRPVTVLDIASNDGTQLNFFKQKGLKTYGIDPAENLYNISSKNHDVVCDFFPSKNLNVNADIIVAQNVFAHTNDIYSFLTSCRDTLSKNGVIFIQTSQANMIPNNEFDTVYHEHLSFFNTRSMLNIVKRCGLILNNVFKFNIHGTSYVFEISNRVSDDSNTESVLESERIKGLYDFQIYKNFADNAKTIITDLTNTIQLYKNKGYKIIGYGAAAKGMTLLNYGSIILDLIVDDNPLKHNLLTPGGDIKILPPDIISNFSAECKIMFIPLSWNFFDEIVKKIQSKRSCVNDVYVRYFPKVVISNI